MALLNFNDQDDSSNNTLIATVTKTKSRDQQRLDKPTFLEYLNRMTIDVNPNIVLVLLGFIAKLTTDKEGSDLSERMCSGIINTSNLSLTFSEALQNALSDMFHMNFFILAYAAAQTLTLLLSKVLAATLVSLAPLYYFPPLFIKASKLSVIISGTSVLLPLFWFQFLGALVLSLLEVLVMLLVLYISWHRMPNTPNLEPKTPFEVGESNDQTMVEGIVRDVVEMVEAVQSFSDSVTNTSNLV